jgi:hypothetical protein
MSDHMPHCDPPCMSAPLCNCPEPDNRTECDSCHARGFMLTWSPDHGAHFCDGCYDRETGGA